MTLHLPAIVEDYFRSQNAHDIEALVACFAPDAVVRDEGHDIAGQDAIRAWALDTSARYQVSVEPLECRADAGRTVVVAKVSGTFPGSPIDLTFRFGLSAGARITALEIG